MMMRLKQVSIVTIYIVQYIYQFVENGFRSVFLFTTYSVNMLAA